MSIQIATNNQVLYGSLGVGDDLMDGILAICKEHQIHSGMVTCIGSLDKTGFTVFKVNEKIDQTAMRTHSLFMNLLS